jgi:hypothetical protein
MRVKEQTNGWSNEDEQLYQELFYHSTLENVRQLVIQHGQDNILSEINKYLEEMENKK